MSKRAISVCSAFFSKVLFLFLLFLSCISKLQTPGLLWLAESRISLFRCSMVAAEPCCRQAGPPLNPRETIPVHCSGRFSHRQLQALKQRTLGR